MSGPARPVAVLVGPPGAGKTTFINSFLRERAALEAAVADSLPKPSGASRM